MASKFAVSDGNFTSTIWASGATGTGSENIESAARGYSTTLTTSMVWCPAFTVTASETIDGVLVLLKKYSNGARTGTITCALSDDAGVTETRTKTLTLSDLFDAGDLPQGDEDATMTTVLFVFDTPLAADGGSDYRIGLKTSSSNQVRAYRTATSADWFRLLRTTTTGQSVSASDHLVVTVANGSGTRTVTMNENSSTKYGHLLIGTGGVVTWVANANTQLRLGGRVDVCRGAAMRMGTTGTPIDRAYTAKLEFEWLSNLGSNYIVGEWTAQGQSRTSGKNVAWCLLDADASNGATSLTVDTDTGWKSGDTVIIAPTTATRATIHSTTLNGDAGASTLTLTSGLNAARSGTGSMKAEIINLTRNVTVKGISATYRPRFVFQFEALIDLDWVGFSVFGLDGTASFYIFGNSASTMTIDYCAFDLTTVGNYPVIYASAYTNYGNNLTVRSCVFGSGGTSCSAGAFIDYYTIGNATITDNVGIAVTGGEGLNNNYMIVTTSATISRNRFACVNYGLYITGNFAAVTLEDNVAHTTEQSCYYLTSCYNMNLVRGIAYNTGVNGSSIYMTYLGNVNIVDAFLAGGANGVQVSIGITDVTFTNCTFATTTSRSTAYGLYFYASDVKRMYVDRCTFTTATADLRVPSNGTPELDGVWCRGCTHTATRFSMAASNVSGTVSIDTGNTHERWVPAGWVRAEGTTYRTAAPSAKLTAASNTSKLSVSFFAKIYASGNLAPSIYVRKDGSYNGNAPRLIQRASPQLGTAFNSDVVLDTFSAGADTWEELTGTSNTATYDGVVEFVVDCDGTAGNVFVDDFTVQ